MFTHMFSPGTTLTLGLSVIVLTLFQFISLLASDWSRPVLSEYNVHVINYIFTLEPFTFATLLIV
jgi:hypothetical protein